MVGETSRIGEGVLAFPPKWVVFGSNLIRRLPAGRYRAMNWLCERATPTFVSSIGITQERMRFTCDLRDGIAREVCFMGYYEPQETVLVGSLLEPGMRFVDVGANWGYFTLLAADVVGPRGRILSFEPHPALYSLLATNLRLNELAWVDVLQLAVSDIHGKKNLIGYAENATNRGVSRLAAKPDFDEPNFIVDTAPLESLLKEKGVDHIDLLKIDIEGEEERVVPTLVEGLQKGRYKAILLELHPAALKARGSSPEAVTEVLLKRGYKGWEINHSDLAFRRAAYRLPTSPKEFLTSYDPTRPLDKWPHVLFLHPKFKAPWE